MKKFINILRKAGFIFIVCIAAFAVGITGQFLPVYRERYQDKKTSTEQIDKKHKDN